MFSIVPFLPDRLRGLREAMTRDDWMAVALAPVLLYLLLVGLLLL